jgi:hypothetical protein
LRDLAGRVARSARLEQTKQQTAELETEIRRRGEVAKIYVPNKILRTDPYLQERSGDAEEPLTLLREVVTSPDEGGRTKLFFLAAQAGQGKSKTLYEFCAAQAQNFLDTESRDPLAFYVDAQGRGLAHLDDALSVALNELNFLLPWRAMVPLIRHGLVALVIDGFDELIGQGGTYNDAYMSLKDYLGEVDGGGVIIGSARSSYFTQEFVSREDTATRLKQTDEQKYILEVGLLLEWSVSQQKEFARKYLDATKTSPDRSSKVLRRFNEIAERGADMTILSRPLFCRSIMEILLSTQNSGLDHLEDLDAIVVTIVGEYLEREQREKIPVKYRDQIMVSHLRRYFVELAQEMWQLETRSIREDNSRVLMEAVCEEEGLKRDAARVLRERANYLPMLKPPANRHVEFEHELFFAHFVSDSLAGLLRTSDSVRKLAKNRFDDDIARAIALTIREDSDSLQQVLTRISDLVSQSTRHDVTMIRLNAGHIVAALLNRSNRLKGALRDLRIEGVDFADTGLLSGVHLVGCALKDVTMDQVDLTGSVFRGVATTTSITRAIVSEETRLILGLDPKQNGKYLQAMHSQSKELVFIDQLLRARIFGQSADQLTTATTDVVIPEKIRKVISRLARHLQTTSRIHEDDGNNKGFMREHAWPEIVELLEAHGLLKPVVRVQASGKQHRVWDRRCSGSELERGAFDLVESDSVNQFWAAIRNRYGKRAGDSTIG